MISRVKHLPALAAMSLLGACAGSLPPPAPAGSPQPAARIPNRAVTPPPTRPAPSSSSFSAPRIMSIPGLESVIGADSSVLQRQFGPARLNVHEGDARKLQFTGEACVLDVYLYPLRPGAEPTATYVDARRASDGFDVDRAACVAALKR